MKIELYTDGACRGNGQIINALSGIGVVLLIPNKEPMFYKEKLKFEPNTNNKAEIYAVIRGLELLFKNYNPFDSNDFVKNRELWENLDRKVKFFEQDFDIEFIKVKGHSGNKWNEKCDQLANNAMDSII